MLSKNTQTSQCSVCQQLFSCGFDDAKKGCWCNRLPLVMAVDGLTGCLCSDCLITAVSKRIKKLLATKSHPELLEIAKDYATDTWVEKIDYTIEDGKYVMSAWHHLKRGGCCNNHCRHCPFTA